MNYQRFRQKVFVPLLVLPAVFGAGALQAQDSQSGQAQGQQQQSLAEDLQENDPLNYEPSDSPVDTSLLDEAADIAEQAFQEARETQATVQELSDEADQLLEEYRRISRTVDGLEVYNAGMRRTIDQQEQTIADYEESIAEAAALQRQIPPLMERMLVALEQFIELDMPFQLDQRRQRIETIRDTFDDADVNIAEKFRLVLQAYQAENNYGRSMQAYTDTLEINGEEREVDMLRVGRIALLYQSTDQTATGMWDKENEQWVSLGDQYIGPVRDAIRMARNLASTEIIELPIPAPEQAQ